MEILKSKKFRVLIASMIALVFVRYLGLEEASAQHLADGLTALGASYIIGQGIADLGAKPPEQGVS